MKKEREKINNFMQFKNQLDAARVVKNEVIKYIKKYRKDP